MGVLGSVIAPSTALMPIRNSQVLGRGPIGPQVIRDALIWRKSILPQKLAHEFQRRPLVPLTLDQNIKDFALGVDGAPQIGHAALDLEIDRVEMPDRVRLGAASAQVRCYHWPEMIHPLAHCS
jgi:hypothetical protein